MNKKIMSFLLMGIIVLLVISTNCNKDGDDDQQTEIKSGKFTDSRDGKVYKTVKINEQLWMAENLAYLPTVSIDSICSNKIPLYYVYNYSGTDVNAAKANANYTVYGVLYNWEAAMDGAGSSNNIPSGVQGACPCGWHLPSDDEWDILVDNLGGSNVAGAVLKGTTYWKSPNQGATNSSGFNGLPGGYFSFKYFVNASEAGYWWSTTEQSTERVFNRSLNYNNIHVFGSNGHKKAGFSIRCIKD